MNKELQKIAENFIDNHNCKADMWKDSNGLYRLNLICLDDYGYDFKISESEELSYSYAYDTSLRHYKGELWLDFGAKRKMKFNSPYLNDIVKNAKLFFATEKAEYLKTQHILTGRYGLISQILPHGEKRVITNFGEYTDDDLSLEDRCKEIVDGLNEAYKDSEYTYNIVDLGVGKNDC